MSDKDTLDDARSDFKLCSDAEEDQRKVSLDDLEFARLGKQWPDDVEKQRANEGRPCLTINRLPAFIKQVTNDARQNRPSIACHPVGDGANKETAGILDGLIRNIQNISRADIVYDTALDFAVTMGFGYWVIRDQYTCEDSFDKDLVLERVSNPFSVYGDWESKEATSVDWNRSFITNLYTKKAFEKKWPDADAAGFEPKEADEEQSLWFADDKIMVAEWWTREEVLGKLLKMSDGTVLDEEKYMEVGSDGFSLKDILDAQMVTVDGEREMRTYKVTQKIISGCDVLETNKWKGKYIPIVPVYGDEINVNGKRYFQSLVRFAKDPQRMFNYWRTASTELVALAPKAPWVGPVGFAATDVKWATANTASHQYLEYDAVPGEPPPQRQPFAGVPAGALQEALNASDDMKNIMGLHDASLGARSNETSGRAIMARQREGDVSTFNFMDNLTRSIEHTGVILIDLIPKHYDAARIIRCIKEDGSTYAVPVNQPVMPAPPQQGQAPMPGMPQEQFQPAPPGHEMDPNLAKIVKVFDLTTGKYDVTVAAGPSFTTKRQEASESMMEFIRVLPQAGMVTADLVAKAQDWPQAEEFAARLRAMLPSQAQGANPQAQHLQQQLQQQDQMAKQAVGQLTQELQQTKQALENKDREFNIKEREVALKERDMDVKEGESKTKNLVEQTNADAQRMQAIDIPNQQLAQQQQHYLEMEQRLNAIAAAVQQKPVHKQAKAVKQPDGSFLLESLERPVQ